MSVLFSHLTKLQPTRIQSGTPAAADDQPSSTSSNAYKQSTDMQDDGAQVGMKKPSSFRHGQSRNGSMRQSFRCRTPASDAVRQPIRRRASAGAIVRKTSLTLRRHFTAQKRDTQSKNNSAGNQYSSSKALKSLASKLKNEVASENGRGSTTKWSNHRVKSKKTKPVLFWLTALTTCIILLVSLLMIWLSQYFKAVSTAQLEQILEANFKIQVDNLDNILHQCTEVTKYLTTVTDVDPFVSSVIKEGTLGGMIRETHERCSWHLLAHLAEDSLDTSSTVSILESLGLQNVLDTNVLDTNVVVRLEPDGVSKASGKLLELSANADEGSVIENANWNEILQLGDTVIASRGCGSEMTNDGLLLCHETLVLPLNSSAWYQTIDPDTNEQVSWKLVVAVNVTSILTPLVANLENSYIALDNVEVGKVTQVFGNLQQLRDEDTIASVSLNNIDGKHVNLMFGWPTNQRKAFQEGFIFSFFAAISGMLLIILTTRSHLRDTIEYTKEKHQVSEKLYVEVLQQLGQVLRQPVHTTLYLMDLIEAGVRNVLVGRLSGTRLELVMDETIDMVKGCTTSVEIIRTAISHIEGVDCANRVYELRERLAKDVQLPFISDIVEMTRHVLAKTRAELSEKGLTVGLRVEDEKIAGSCAEGSLTDIKVLLQLGLRLAVQRDNFTSMNLVIQGKKAEQTGQLVAEFSIVVDLDEFCSDDDTGMDDGKKKLSTRILKPLTFTRSKTMMNGNKVVPQLDPILRKESDNDSSRVPLQLAEQLAVKLNSELRLSETESSWSFVFDVPLISDTCTDQNTKGDTYESDNDSGMSVAGSDISHSKRPSQATVMEDLVSTWPKNLQIVHFATELGDRFIIHRMLKSLGVNEVMTHNITELSKHFKAFGSLKESTPVIFVVDVSQDWLRNNIRHLTDAKSNAQSPHSIPVIAITGSGRQEDIERLLLNGYETVVVKPFAKYQLAKSISNTLQGLLLGD